MTPAQAIRQAIMELSPIERLELGTWLTLRRNLDHADAEEALTGQRLIDRVQTYGVKVVAEQEGVKPASIYARLNRAGWHLRGAKGTGLYKPGHEPRPQQHVSAPAQR